jgi:hypothetical protein
VRGRGLNVGPLSATAQAHVYEAAVRAAFEVDDESLSLLLDPRELPRDIGLAVGARLSDSIGAELRHRGVTKGTCEPPVASNRGSPKCTAALPGYVVRFSPIFTLRGDSVQVYLYAQKYDSPTSGNSDRLRFERACKSFRAATPGAVREVAFRRDSRRKEVASNFHASCRRTAFFRARRREASHVITSASTVARPG